mgnify:CR=1 FL=1
MKRVLRSRDDYKTTLLRNQLTSLVLYEAVTTTQAKAKALVPYVNHFFNRIKTADLTAKRLAHESFFDKNAVKKVFEEILPRYQSTDTTYVRMLKATPRSGDAAPMALVALLKTLKVEPKAKSAATVTTRKKTDEK